jgi:hypothetical protein
MGRRSSTNGRHKKYIQNLSKNLRGKKPLGRPEYRWKNNIKMNLKKHGMKMWTGFIWLKIRCWGTR